MNLADRPELFARYDETPDQHFYIVPRFVTHIDDKAIEAVTNLYREHFPASGDILDLMSSWVSHLPDDVEYRRVVGLGMNAEELAANPRLNEYIVQSLNDNPVLPFSDNSFDGCSICVSIQYLVKPVAVLKEVGRVLRPGAKVVITFSNRCFPSKAVAAWLSLPDEGHVELVARYLDETGCFTDIIGGNATLPGGHDPLFAVIGTRR